MPFHGFTLHAPLYHASHTPPCHLLPSISTLRTLRHTGSVFGFLLVHAQFHSVSYQANSHRTQTFCWDVVFGSAAVQYPRFTRLVANTLLNSHGYYLRISPTSILFNLAFLPLARYMATMGLFHTASPFLLWFVPPPCTHTPTQHLFIHLFLTFPLSWTLPPAFTPPHTTVPTPRFRFWLPLFCQDLLHTSLSSTNLISILSHIPFYYLVFPFADTTAPCPPRTPHSGTGQHH